MLKTRPAGKPMTRREAWLRVGRFAIPAFLVLTWINSKLGLVIVEERWTDDTGTLFVRQNSLWHSDTYRPSQDRKVAMYAAGFTPIGSLGYDRRPGPGQPRNGRNYRWAVRWRIPAAVEEREQYAQHEQAWRQDRYADMARRKERMRQVMQPIERARMSDPQNRTGEVTRALVIAGAGFEKDNTYEEAAYLYEQATHTTGSAAAADLAAAHLGLGRCHNLNGAQLLAREDFKKAAAIPGCPPHMTAEARRELSALRLGVP